MSGIKKKERKRKEESGDSPVFIAIVQCMGSTVNDIRSHHHL